jgi:hypothetical protein
MDQRDEVGEAIEMLEQLEDLERRGAVEQLEDYPSPRYRITARGTGELESQEGQ